jgi:molybdate transport system substrate-binding protein
MSAASRLALLLLAILVVTACSGDSQAGSPSTGTPSLTAAASDAASAAEADLTIYAAASLKKAFAGVKAAYEAANPGVRLTMSFDASSALETQIEQGAPADVFASADTKNPQKLVDAGYATSPVTIFAGNALTVIVPTANPAGIAGPADLARSGVKVVAAGDAVPITRYADRLIANLAGQPGYPADYAAKVRANTVSREDNVAAVVSKVELGEGDAAIVYVSDARNSTRVTALAVPADANVPATYGVVTVKASMDPAAAAAFTAWLAGPEAQAILATYGFLPLP